MKPCLHCRKKFRAYQNKKYCSDYCRLKAWRARRRKR